MILLDTNVISELMKPRPDKAVERWFLMHEEELWLASVAVGEVAYGIAKLDAGARRAGLEAQLGEWRVRFAGRMHGFGVTAAMIYGEILATARRAGRPMSVADAQIAAIAVEQGAVLATRNGRDFDVVEVELANPWG